MSIQQILYSLIGNFEKKTRNPFFGTLALVVLYKNWKLIYSIFNFDDGLNRSEKIFVIIDYLPKGFLDWIGKLSGSIGIALLIIIVGYTLVNLTRLITNTYENWLTPWIYEITKGKIYTESQYENISVKLRASEQRESELWKQNSDLIEDRQGYEKRISELEIVLEERDTLMGDLEANKGESDRVKSLEVERDQLREDRGKLSGEVKRLEETISSINRSKICIFSVEGKPGLDTLGLNFGEYINRIFVESVNKAGRLGLLKLYRETGVLKETIGAYALKGYGTLDDFRDALVKKGINVRWMWQPRVIDIINEKDIK